VYEFISEYVGKYQNVGGPNTPRVVLDPNKPASVSVNIQTDFSGKATFLGIDLSKLDLGSIANFITIANKSPTLQAYLNPKETVSSQIDFALPQTNHDTYVEINWEAPRYVFDGHSLTEWAINKQWLRIQKIQENGITLSYNQYGLPTTEVDGVTPITYDKDHKKIAADSDGNPTVDQDGKPITHDPKSKVNKTNNTPKITSTMSALPSSGDYIFVPQHEPRKDGKSWDMLTAFGYGQLGTFYPKLKKMADGNPVTHINNTYHIDDKTKKVDEYNYSPDPRWGSQRLIYGLNNNGDQYHKSLEFPYGSCDKDYKDGRSLEHINGSKETETDIYGNPK
jgi:hypothetical protein